MTTTADKKVFLDTNIVLRLLNPELDPDQRIENFVKQFQTQDYKFWISRQVIREYLVQITRPGYLKTPFSGEPLQKHVETLYTLFQVADETQAVADRLLQLLRDIPTGGKQIHDANIVATMLVNGVTTLLTLNGEDMRRFNAHISIAAPQ